MRTLELDPRSLKPNPWNSNRVSPDNMVKLKRSIQDLGFASAVVVRTLKNGDHQILGGAHRVEAAIALGLKTVPVVNVGEIDDTKARKIGLVDNHRYGNDDAIQLAKIIEEIGADTNDLIAFLPVSGADIEAVMGVVDIDLDAFDLEDDDDEDPDDDAPAPKERALVTHEVMKFRVPVADAAKIRVMIEKTIKREGLGGGDEMTTAGEALARLLVNDD